MRQNHRGPVVAPEWFRGFSGSARDQTPPRSGVLDQATLAPVPLNLDGYPTPQDPVQRLVSIDVKSGVEKQLATLDPPPGLHPGPGASALIRTATDSPSRFVRQHGNIYMREGFDESTSWFDPLMRRF
jgi:hypothetical protein